MAGPSGTRPARCVGIDGAGSGWLAVWDTPDGLAHAWFAQVRQVHAVLADAAVIAVDIPMGLAEDGPRQAEILARRFVGGRRACSVFPAPLRGIMHATDRAEASRMHRQLDRGGRGFGAQAFALLPKIRDWDEMLRADAGFAAKVFEIHPEVSFAALQGGYGVVEPKRSAAGQAVRARLLSAVYGGPAVEALLASVPRRSGKADDVLDALAAHWSATRLAAGAAGSLPTPAATDSLGLRMAIHY